LGNNPILSNHILGDQAGDPRDGDKHKVAKNETLSGISKSTGVSIKDLQAMNNIKDPNKIKAGQILIVNPETNFLNSPYAAPASNNGMNDQYAIVNDKNKISRVALNFLRGNGAENTVYTQGGVLNMVQTAPPVQNLMDEGMSALLADGKLTPGEVFKKSYQIKKIYQENGRRLLWEQTKKIFGGDNDNSGFTGAEGILGSFDFSMRVKADGYTIAIAVYDNKTVRSLSDGNSSTSLRKLPMTKVHLSTTYQRYIWDMVLCAPGLNQKKR